MPIQNIKLIAVAPMNMLQAEIYEYAFVLLGAIGFAGIVMFISAAVRISSLWDAKSIGFNTIGRKFNRYFQN